MMDRLIEAALLAIVLLIVIALAGCRDDAKADPYDWGIARVVKTQTDDNGVVCYAMRSQGHDLPFEESFHCVKVTP